MGRILFKILKYVLKRLAKLTIWRFEPKVIAITGSAGKTSSKEAVYAVLKNHFKTRKSSGNLNNELGVPLTIIGDWAEGELKLVSRDTPAGAKKIRKFIFWIKVFIFALVGIFFRKLSYPEVLILEYGADRPGDISYLCEISRPYIGVITVVGEMPVHVEFFSGPEAVAREKAKLIECLSASGFAVLNFDNEITRNMKEKTRAREITFGFSEEADVKIGGFEFRLEGDKPLGISFKIEYGGSFVPVIMNDVFGKGQARAAAVGACAGLIFDLNLVEISHGLSENYKPAKGRMNLKNGVNGSYIIDDSYNASPLSVKEALETMENLPAQRRVAVLGDMLELGKFSQEAHKKIGLLAAGIVDVLVTIGPMARLIAESAVKSGFSQKNVKSFDTVEEVTLLVEEMIKKGDLVLVKASRGVGLDKVVEKIVAPIV